MTKEKLVNYCAETYGTVPDCPFEEDFVTTVLRHGDTKKWYGIVMEISRRKFGIDSDETTSVLNVKLPTEMHGSFSKADGVYPAYHMNKNHWVSVVLADAPDDLVEFLINVSFEVTERKRSPRKRNGEAK